MIPDPTGDEPPNRPWTPAWLLNPGAGLPADLVDDLTAALTAGWQNHARCADRSAGYDPEWWFPAPKGSSRAAVRVCVVCPVQRACLAWALLVGPGHGIWGGLRTDTRLRLRHGLVEAYREGLPPADPLPAPRVPAPRNPRPSRRASR